MIIIHAFFKVDPTQRTEFLEQAKVVISKSQAEEGNITYELYENTVNSNDFVMLEKWKDQAAIDQHEETSHFNEFIKFINDERGVLLEPLHVEIYGVAKEK